jgi:hypothetical protein
MSWKIISAARKPPALKLPQKVKGFGQFFPAVLPRDCPIVRL